MDLKKITEKVNARLYGQIGFQLRDAQYGRIV